MRFEGPFTVRELEEMMEVEVFGIYRESGRLSSSTIFEDDEAGIFHETARMILTGQFAQICQMSHRKNGTRGLRVLGDAYSSHLDAFPAGLVDRVLDATEGWK